MSGVRDTLGMDWIDVLIHAGVTGTLIGFVAVSNGPEPLFPVITGLSLVVFGIRRHIALRRPGLTTGEVNAERLAEVELRLSELEAAQARVVELEERLDFAERLLAKGGGPRLVGRGETP